MMLSIVLMVVAVATFSPLDRAGLVWSDAAHIEAMAQDQAPLSRQLARAWTPQQASAFKPLADTMLVVAKASFGPPALTPRTLHRLQVALHALSSVLVFLILARCIQNLPASFLGACLFAIHPLQVESVALVATLPILLGTAASLAALLAFLAYSQRLEPHGREPRRASYYVATLFLVLAMLAHPAFVVVPAMAFLLQRLVPRRDSMLAPRRSSWPLALWWLLAVGLGLLSINGLKDPLAATTSFWSKPLLAGDAASFYLSKLFVPLFMGPDYGRSPSLVLSQWWGYATWIFPTALLAMLLLFGRGRGGQWYASAALVTFCALIPWLGFVPMRAWNNSTVADRYVYLAMIGPSLALAYGITMARRSWLPVVAILALAVFGALSYRNTKPWLDDQALWTHALAVNPDSPIAHERLGNAYRLAGDLERASEHYEKVLHINATSPDIHFYLASMEASKGDDAKAMALYEKTLQLDPHHGAAWLALGKAHEARGDIAEAKACFEKVLAKSANEHEALQHLGTIEARFGDQKAAISLLTQALATSRGENAATLAKTHALLGQALATAGDQAKARQHLEQALALAPDHPEAHRTIADVYFAQGELDAALPHYEKALATASQDAAAYRNLGVILANRNSYERAAQAYTKALELKPNWAEAHLNLGAAYFHMRRFPDATAQLLKVLELDANAADAHYYLGDIARWQGKKSEAIATYYRALRINPHHRDANYRLGNHFLARGQPDQAARHYEAALRDAPDDPQLRLSLRKAQGNAEGRL